MINRLIALIIKYIKNSYNRIKIIEKCHVEIFRAESFYEFVLLQINEYLHTLIFKLMYNVVIYTFKFIMYFIIIEKNSKKYFICFVDHSFIGTGHKHWSLTVITFLSH